MGIRRERALDLRWRESGRKFPAKSLVTLAVIAGSGFAVDGSHAYTTLGMDTLSVAITDHGASQNQSGTVTVTPGASAHFTAPKSVKAGAIASFNAAGSHGEVGEAPVTIAQPDPGEATSGTTNWPLTALDHAVGAWLLFQLSSVRTVGALLLF
jgi:hypothetical protein